jgi:hypothetical protein
MCDHEHNALDGENGFAPLFLSSANFYGYFKRLTLSQLYNAGERIKGLLVKVAIEVLFPNMPRKNDKT